jgi:hypothetical protein
LFILHVDADSHLYDSLGIYESDAGYLVPESCVAAYLDVAEDNKVYIHVCMFMQYDESKYLLG